jgi:large subunit ribosomal protein L9
VIEKRVAKERANATEIAGRMNGMTLQFERMVGEDEKLFGSVTPRDIADQLKRANVEIDHRWIQLDQPVKALGKYEVPVRLAAGVIANLKFWVVGKDK